MSSSGWVFLDSGGLEGYASVYAGGCSNFTDGSSGTSGYAAIGTGTISGVGCGVLKKIHCVED